MLTQLIKAIILLMVIALPLWIALRIKINLSRPRRNKRLLMKRELLLGCFFVYVVLVAGLTIVPLPISRFRGLSSFEINFIPIVNSVRCFSRAATEMQRQMRTFCLENIAGNIILFLPLGALLPFASHKFRSLKSVLLVAALSSLSIEMIQLLSRLIGSYRAVDVDDILFNTLGAFLGFIVYTKANALFYAEAAI